MKIKYIGIISLAMLFLFGCTDKNEALNKRIIEYKQNVGLVYQIPEDSLSSEQKNILDKLKNIIMKHVNVKNNKYYLDMSRADFLQMGIPEIYFDILEQNMRDNNSFIKKNKINNAEDMLQGAKEEYFIRECPKSCVNSKKQD